MGLHTFKYSHCWYGRGSKDWDYYKCTSCAKEIMLSEDTDIKDAASSKETCEEYLANKKPVSYHQVYETSRGGYI